MERRKRKKIIREVPTVKVIWLSSEPAKKNRKKENEDKIENEYKYILSSEGQNKD